ncbi:hypothetical protein [Bacillus sp. NPDC077027]|uniref:hypothetical protein n=1 Tax=Bacillus sp. NPDC077027 TaxID=3390548 RepID=UPI003CFEB0C6
MIQLSHLNKIHDQKEFSMGYMDSKNRRLLFTVLLTVLLLAVISSHYVSPTSTNAADKKQTITPKNIIFVVGDGMGMPVIKAYRTFKRDLKPDILSCMNKGCPAQERALIKYVLNTLLDRNHHHLIAHK